MCECQQKVFLVKEKFNQGDLTEVALLTYALNRPGFLEAMKAKGLEVSADTVRSDMEMYTELSRNGGDLRGDLTDKNGNPIKFNFKELVLSIPVSLKELEQKIQFN